MPKPGYVYIMTSTSNTVLYTGVTSSLVNRVFKHKNGYYRKSFTCRYNCHKLVWYQCFLNIEDAIEREKQIKAGSRAKKLALVNEMNPEWKDLFESIC